MTLKGSDIKRLREAYKLTVRKFAARVGVSSSLAVKWERGERAITRERADSIINEFNLTLENIHQLRDIDIALRTMVK